MPDESRQLVTASWLLQIQAFDKVHEILFPDFQFVGINLHVYVCVRSILLAIYILLCHQVLWLSVVTLWGTVWGGLAWDERMHAFYSHSIYRIRSN